MTASQRILKRESEAIGDCMKIRFYPFVAEAARGTRMIDVDGNSYLDFLSCGGVVQVGFRHPMVESAIIHELRTLGTTNHCVYPGTSAVVLAERLCELLPGSFPKKAWFGATGSDANDCLARLLPIAQARPRIVSYVGGYHGQTLGSAMLSGHSAQARVMAPNVTKVPYPYCYRCLWGRDDPETCGLLCLRFVEDVVFGSLSPAADTAAVVLEAVQSDNGDVIAPDNYLVGLRDLCDEHGIWLVFDEVKTGLGRTGRMFSFEHAGIVADAVSLGKPLGGGLPLSAVVGRRELLDVPTFDLFTLGGAPACCAGGLATLDVIAGDNLIQNAAVLGERLLDGLIELQRRHESVGHVRGKGLIAGIELVKDRKTREPDARAAARLVYRCYELGLLVIYTGILANVIELTPALNVSASEVDRAVEIIDMALSDVESGRFDDAKLAPFGGW